MDMNGNKSTGVLMDDSVKGLDGWMDELIGCMDIPTDG